MPEPNAWLFPAFTDHDQYNRGMKKLSDLHIYTGSKCNRQCDFCIVAGRPDGWYEPITEETLSATLAMIPLDSTIKFYGGEPTIAPDNLLWAMNRLRELGFRGWFTIFSNGVLADRLIKLLEADDRTDVVLNYSILHSEDAEPIPPASLAKLKAFAALYPHRIYSSHAGVFPFGRGVDFVTEVGQTHINERMHASMAKKIETGQLDHRAVAKAEERGFRICPRCRPVVSTDGRHHACPFAVESRMPHFDLGAVTDPSEQVLLRYQQFLDWIDNVLEPEAEALRIHPCLVCTNGLSRLPQPY
jgi:organic radical activating enzyme